MYCYRVGYCDATDIRTWLILPNNFDLTTSTRCVYLADDDEDDNVFFEIALRNYFPDYQYCHFSDGSHLLTALHEGSYPYPDMIFLDVQMPLLSGPDTYKALQVHPQWTLIPACLLTSSYELAYVAQKHELPVRLLRTKPTTFGDMQALILSHLPN